MSSPPVSDENVHPSASPLSTFTEFEQPRILVENNRKSSSFNWLKTVGLRGLLGFIGLGTWYFIGQQNEINVEEKHIFPTIESIENKEIAPIEKNTSLEEPFLEKKKNTKKKSEKKTKKSVIPKRKKKEIIPVSTLSTEIAPVIPLEVINKQSPQTKIDREVIPFPSVLIDSFKLDSLEKN